MAEDSCTDMNIADVEPQVSDPRSPLSARDVRPGRSARFRRPLLGQLSSGPAQRAVRVRARYVTLVFGERPRSQPGRVSNPDPRCSD